MPEIVIRKRHGWWWVSRQLGTLSVPFRTWREAYDYALTVVPWPLWFNGRS